ncbi:MAG: hypothetical protein HZB65_03895, partial [Candidatus Aenigmarchaeota archaeon]|nr:hypothetical protein [Candidatus Aenigmarchaeota archaeon]
MKIIFRPIIIVLALISILLIAQPIEAKFITTSCTSFKDSSKTAYLDAPLRDVQGQSAQNRPDANKYYVDNTGAPIRYYDIYVYSNIGDDDDPFNNNYDDNPYDSKPFGEPDEIRRILTTEENVARPVWYIIL